MKNRNRKYHFGRKHTKFELRSEKNRKIIQDYWKQHREKRTWYRALCSLAVVVIIITIRLLVMPALTLEEDVAQESAGIVFTPTESADAQQNESQTGQTTSEEDGETDTALISEDPSVFVASEELSGEEYGIEEASISDETGSDITDTDGESLNDAADDEEDFTDDFADDEFADEEDTLLTVSELPEDGVDLTNYITSTVLYYKCADATPAMTDWEEVTNDTVLHGNDSLYVVMKYSDVPIADVKAHSYRAIFPYPDWMEGAVQAATPFYDSTGLVLCGTNEATEEYLKITFDQSWLDSQSGTYLNGTLEREATMDVSEIEGETLTVGGFVAHVDYDASDWDAKYADIDIAKSDGVYIEQENDEDLIQYQITVSSGEEPMENVVVKDAFEDAATENYIKEIVGVTSEDTKLQSLSSQPADSSAPSYAPVETSDKTDASHGSLYRENRQMIWTIGDLEANETRTLTYYVRLKAEETGRSHTNAVVFHNVATVYCKGIERKTEDSTFNLIGKTTMSKTMVLTEDEDGIGATATYYIWVKALSENTYVMDNLKIFDYIAEWSNGSQYADKPVELLENSFHLYKGGYNQISSVDGLTEIKNVASLNPLYPDANAVNPSVVTRENNNTFQSFTFYIGDLAPEDSVTLVYQLRIQDAPYLTNDGSMQLHNRALVYEDDTKNTVTPAPNSGQIQGYTVYSTISYDKWVQKYEGVRQETEQTCTLGSSVYEFQGDDIVKQSSPAASYSVPSGSYQYSVIVNEGGLIDVNTATMSDLLGTNMQYLGYAKIDAFDSLDASQRDGLSAANASAQPTRSAYLKIDGKSSFTFTPADLGFTGTHAYRITYYTQVVDVEDNTYVNVNNDFEMSGTVGGGYELVKGRIVVRTTTQAMASSTFHAEKGSWYYAQAKTGDPQAFSKGSLYWYIKVTGNTIPANMILQDKTVNSSENSDTGHTMVSGESFLGIYEGGDSLPANMTKLQASTEFTEFTGNYEVTYENGAVSVKFPDTVTLNEDKALYLVIRTAIASFPAQNNTKTYNNSLYMGRDPSDLAYVETSQQSVVNKKNIEKKLQGAFIYDGTTYRQASNTANTYSRGQNDGAFKTWNNAGQRLDEGTYIEYLIDINQSGMLTGSDTYVISDVLPEGLEVAFLRVAWFNGYSADNIKMEELEDNEAWKRYEEYGKYGFQGTGPDKDNPCIYYYNSETREIRWSIRNIQSTSTSPQFVRFQLVCKVVDQDVLLGVKSGVYTNSVSILQDDIDGNVMGKDTATSVRLSKKSMSKSIAQSQGGSVIPFQIEVNPFSEDLIKTSDTLVLIDELSSTLTPDIGSLQVTDSSGNLIIDYTLSIEKEKDVTYLRITLPDEKKLTLTYNASVSVAAGQSVAIQNVAHWEGYEAAEGTSVTNSSYQYSVSVTVTGEPDLKIIKVDAENVKTRLSGATFTMQEASYVDGNWQLTGEVYTATTDENGTAYFSKEGTRWMKFNTIYCIRETQAPEGYVRDTTPVYVALDNGQLTYPDEVQVVRNQIEYTYYAMNEKGQIELEKKFRTTGGTDLRNGPAGTYRFGLYEDTEVLSDQPLQILTIECDKDGTATYHLQQTASGSSQQVQKLHFINLDLNTTYAVYELNEDGSPIRDSTQAFEINGVLFDADYETPNTGLTPSDVSDVTTKVTITNEETITYELPGTGGVGRKWFIISGLLLLAISVTGYFVYNKAGKK